MTRTVNDYPTRTFTPTKDHIMWIFDGEFQPLDNFAEFPVKVDIGFGERVYQTGEHAFAAAKATTKEIHNTIADLKDTYRVKGMGQRVPLRTDWEQVKFQIMFDIVHVKFLQNYAVRRCLKSTVDRPIYEGNHWMDRTWGVTQNNPSKPEWTGRNALGMILMEIRKDYFGVEIKL